jgi:hypothetical protein
MKTQPIGLRQNEPPKGEGRKGYPLQVNGPNVTFLTGAEVYEWKSNSLGVGSPSAIMGAWVDATNVAQGKQLTLNFNNGLQVFDIPGGSQGYIVCTVQAPVDLIVTTNNGAGVTVTIILYNYNPLFTGSVSTNSAPPPVAGGTTGGGTGGSGGGGINPACFTGETRIKTAYGWQRFDELPLHVTIHNETGKWLAEVITHEVQADCVISLPGGRGRVNMIHGIKVANGEYVEAAKVWPMEKRSPFRGILYNLHVVQTGERVPTEADAHYIVEPDIVAHNLRPIK